MNPSSTNWLTAAWAAGRRQAELIVQALAGKPGRAVVLPNRHLTGAPSIITLACILERASSGFPAILVSCAELVEFHRCTLAEGLPDASIAVLDRCHPTPAHPAEITLLCESQLTPSAATLAGYQPATIAIFAGIDAPDERHHQAISSLLDCSRDPLIVVEEWTRTQILAAVVARHAGIADQDAHVTVADWLERLLDPTTGPPTRTLTGHLLAVRDLQPQATPAAA
jgi:hypothetical protein